MRDFTIDTHGKLEPHLQTEWLLTNDLGGFAAGTVVGCNTRRYHGLLVAATLPPVGRVMLLNRVGEILHRPNGAGPDLELSVNCFGDQFHPRGDRFLRRFELDDNTARWHYEADGIRVVKELRLAYFRNIAALRYTIDPAGSEVELHLLPFVRLMDFHSLRHGKTDFHVSHDEHDCFVANGDLAIHLTSDSSIFRPQPDWWFNHTYPVETERGQDDREDLYTPGRFIISVKQPTTITLWASLVQPDRFGWDDPKSSRTTSSAAGDIGRLLRAADDFIVRRTAPNGNEARSIIAGYPWFADWGRDAMIALPGLLLSTGRFDNARRVLSLFARYVSEGMIPNCFDDYTNRPLYNTVDASLWFIHAAFEYARLSGDRETMQEILLPACREIVAGYTRGTRYNIAVDPSDGLVTQGDANTQLTWMDAKCDGIAFTPRQGKAVEINALWHHALRLMGNHAEADRVAANFREQFWISPFRGLADVVDGSRRDTSCRPNQIFAVSLSPSPLTREQQSAVVEAVRRELLTPMGLRSLNQSDPRYHGRYTGPARQRDEAYHNGTVWTWLIGPFLEAYLIVHDHSPEAVEQARRWLAPLLDHMNRGCLGQLPEIFDGDEPQRPVGAFAQAWSIGEVLRLAVMLML